MTNIFKNLSESIFWYETHKIFRMRHKRIGIFYFLLKLTVLLYVFGYLLIYKKAYQFTETGKYTTSYKVKGVLPLVPENVSLTPEIADNLDFSFNPQDPQSIILLTSIQRTFNQTQRLCLDHSWSCTSNEKCPQGSTNMNKNAIATGNCVEDSSKSTKKFCEVKGWCPLEDRSSPRYYFGDDHLLALDELTLFIKSRVTFDHFSYSGINIPTNFSKSDLAKCRYDPNDPINKDCPIFKLSNILNLNSEEAHDVAKNGAVYEINVDWKCNLDYGLHCMPSYSFIRTDSLPNSWAEGYNLRFTKNFFFNGKEYRNLYKASAIVLSIKLKTQASKFDIVRFALSVGSGLALLGLTQVICKSLLIYVLPNREIYKRMLIEERTCDDAVDIETSPLMPQ